MGGALSGRRLDVAVAATLAAAVLAVFGQSAGFGFLTWDDLGYVTDNARVRQGLTWDNLVWVWSALEFCNWHPLTWLSHMADVSLFGLAPAGHHLVSVALHALNAVLLYLFFRRATAAPWRSALVALLFAIHPLHAESVVWVSERKDVLSTLFWLAALHAYLGYARAGGALRYLAVTAWIAAGLAAKPMVVTLPCVLLLLDLWPLRRAGVVAWTRLALEKLPWLALAAGSAFVTLHAQSSCGAVSELQAVPLADRFAHAAIGYASYLYYTLAPWKLSYMHLLPAQWDAAQLALSLSLVAGVSIWVAGGWREHPGRLVGWLWYLGTLVPVIGLVQVGHQAIAARYSYVPLIGVFVVLAWSAPRRISRAGGLAVALVLAVYAGVAFWQAGYWRDSQTLYRRALEIDPDNFVAHTSLADALGRAGRYAEARAHARAALDRIGERPFAKHALITLGSIADRERDPLEALAYFDRALALDSKLAAVQFNRGVVLAKLRRYEEAAAAYRGALALDAANARAHDGLGFALVNLGRAHEAVGHYVQAIAIDPAYAQAHFNLGVAREALGQADEAIASYESALRLGPDNGVARLRLGRLLLLTGRPQQAAAQFEAVLRADAGNAPARALLEEAQRGLAGR